MNYDSSQVGVPYCRVNNIVIQYPPIGIPMVTLEQESAVKLADNSIVRLGVLPSISFSLDMISNAASPIALINPTTGANLGANTNLQQVMLGILAVIRQQQLLLNT